MGGPSAARIPSRVRLGDWATCTEHTDASQPPGWKDCHGTPLPRWVGAILEDFLLFKLTRAASLLIEVLGGEIARVRFLDRRSFDDHLLELVHRDGLLLLAHLRLGHLLEEVKRCQS